MGPTQINKRNGHPDKSHNRSEIKKKKHKNFNLKWRLGRCCSDRPRYSILNFPMVGLAGGSDYSAQRNSKPHSDTSPEIQGIKNPGHPGPQIQTPPTGVGDKWCDVKRDMPGLRCFIIMLATQVHLEVLATSRVSHGGQWTRIGTPLN